METILDLLGVLLVGFLMGLGFALAIGIVFACIQFVYPQFMRVDTQWENEHLEQRKASRLLQLLDFERTALSVNVRIENPTKFSFNQVVFRLAFYDAAGKFVADDIATAIAPSPAMDTISTSLLVRNVAKKTMQQPELRMEVSLLHANDTW